MEVVAFVRVVLSAVDDAKNHLPHSLVKSPFGI